ncbi:MAG: 1-acyl-sn-glycerol-3-phosphate acyltransferase [Thermoleophilia bacterium]|nr:1-acyl-sn-glycerol-3-phosphate acyltransferase [Thermoleophilia bacterium]
MSTTPHSEPRTYEDADYEPWLTMKIGLLERVIRLLTLWYWNHVFRAEAHGVEHLPETGAYLMVPNHSSYADPFLQAAPQRRNLRFMAKSTMFRYPVVSHFMKGGGGFPVNRGRGDVFAMELARRLLRDGWPVVVYPEGTRYRQSAELGPAKRGAARLALETGVPVVPAATWGVKRREVYGRPRWRRPRAVTVFGAPLDFSHLELTPEHVDEVRDIVWERVHELYDEARRIAESRSSRRGGQHGS